jgi:hypothetical protein
MRITIPRSFTIRLIVEKSGVILVP